MLTSFGADKNNAKMTRKIDKTVNQISGRKKKIKTININRNITIPINEMSILTMGFLTSLLFTVILIDIYLTYSGLKL